MNICKGLNGFAFWFININFGAAEVKQDGAECPAAHPISRKIERKDNRSHSHFQPESLRVMELYEIYIQ